MGIDHDASYHGLDVLDRLSSSRIGCSRLGHKFNGLPCRQAFLVGDLLPLEVLNVRLQLQKSIPILRGKRSIVMKKEETYYKTDRVWQHLGVKFGKYFGAFVFVASFP